MAYHHVFAATALIARNSLDYVSRAFRLYEQGRPFVSVASRGAAEALAAIKIEAFEEPVAATGWFVERHVPRTGPDAAQVSFTSGTTGTPKGVVLTHDALGDTTKRLIDVMALDEAVREYVAVPPGYSFGLGRFRACAAVGGHAFLPANGFDPAELGRMLRSGEVNALSAVPTLLRLLIERADLIGTAGARMRWVEIGSQPMSRAEKESVKALFPEARIVQHYGLTEASRTTFLDIGATDGALLESVGRPIGATGIEIGLDGRIRIRGPHVAREAIGAAGMMPLVDGEGWLTTNDTGEIRDGYLYFHGRADDLINYGGIKLVPDRIEERLRERLVGSSGIAVARIPDALRGDGILVATEEGAAAAADVRSAALEVLAGFGVAAGGGLQVATVAALPVTATGKVQRGRLAEMVAADQRAAAVGIPSPAQDMSPPSDVLRVFRRAFPRQSVARTDSFMSLGGDSLAHVSILAGLEDGIGRVPETWEGRSIADLETLLPAGQAAGGGPFSLRAVSSELVLRAGAIVLIVFHHALHVDLSGGIEVLLLLVGVNLARFQTERLASPSRLGIVKDVLVRLVLPYYLIIIAYKMKNPQLVSWPDFLLVSNFFGRHGLLSTPYWFVQGYLQTLLIFVALATVPAIRRAMIERPGRFGAALLGVTFVGKLLGVLAFHHQVLRGRTPDQFLYIIALGWCLQEARTTGQRAGLVAFALIVVALDRSGAGGLWSGFGGSWHAVWLLVSVLMLVLAPSIRLPGLIRTGAIEIALASLVIYLSHPVLLIVLNRLFREPRPSHVSSYLLIGAILLIGVVLYRLLGVAARHAPRLLTLPGARAFSFGRSR